MMNRRAAADGVVARPDEHAGAVDAARASPCRLAVHHIGAALIGLRSRTSTAAAESRARAPGR